MRYIGPLVVALGVVCLAGCSGTAPVEGGSAVESTTGGDQQLATPEAPPVLEDTQAWCDWVYRSGGAPASLIDAGWPSANAPEIPIAVPLGDSLQCLTAVNIGARDADSAAEAESMLAEYTDLQLSGFTIDDRQTTTIAGVVGELVHVSGLEGKAKGSAFIAVKDNRLRAIVLTYFDFGDGEPAPSRETTDSVIAGFVEGAMSAPMPAP